MKKFFTYLSLCALLLTGCAQTQQFQPAEPETEEISASLKILSPSGEELSTMENGRAVVSREVAYWDGNEQVKGYLAMPQDAENLPAVILIHEWWGLNDNMRDMAKEFAGQGYVALAVDLYNGQATADSAVAQQLAGNVRSNMDTALKNLTAAVEYLKKTPGVDETRLASVGWCFGGGWAYQMARNDMGVKATVMYYGQFSPEDDLSHMKASIIGHFGEKDTGIKVDNVREFQATLKTLSGNHEVYIYPNAGHGFANPDNPNYNKEAADTAWQRTMEFLTKYL